MKAPIKRHKEWEIVEKWFKTRGGYGHVEHISIEPIFTPETIRLAEDMGKRAGESVAKLCTNLKN